MPACCKLLLPVAAFLVMLPLICRAEPTYIEEKNIVFDRQDGTELIMDMKTLDDGRKNKPCCIAIHGGGWSEGSVAASDWLGASLVDLGYTVFGITYRLAPAHPFPAQIEDCKSAVRFVRANAKRFGIDPKRVAVYGSSAGGHLASLLGVLPRGVFEGNGPNKEYSSRADLVINSLGPEDLEFFLKVPKSALPGVFGILFGETGKDTALLAAKASPISYVTKDSAPHLLLYGGRDDLVYAAQGELFYDRLRQAGAYGEIHISPESGHGLPDEFKMRFIPGFLKRFFGEPDK
ncbi:MAG: alpha/beta hydrolase [Abditibacteriota bacterium]|nr:alpha/beta hydrolase [Abditibacteriota bacterium]